ncbi:hypothetical protein M407DRAFT_35179, partial [Tulasnella calospora MUT 4182]
LVLPYYKRDPKLIHRNSCSSSSITSKSTTSSIEIDPFGPIQTVGPYLHKKEQIQPERPFIPEGWEDQVISWIDDNPFIRRQGDLELNIYRNYHGDNFYWNDLEIKPNSVILNDLEGSITIYTSQDLDHLLKETSDADFCKSCLISHETRDKSRDNRPSLNHTTSVPIYTIPELKKRIEKDEMAQGKRPVYIRANTSNSHPNKKPSFQNLRHILSQVIVIEQLYQSDDIEALKAYIEAPQITVNLLNHIQYIEDPNLREILNAEYQRFNQASYAPKWEIHNQDWESVEKKFKIDEEGDWNISSGSDEDKSQPIIYLDRPKG